MEELLEDEAKSKNTSKSKPSLDSIEEMSSKNRTFFRLTLITINIISFIIGIYILYNNNYYLNPDFKFSNYISLYFFIILYSFGMLSALILSFLFSLVLKIIYHYKNNNSKDNNINSSKIDLMENEQDHSQISIFILNDKQNEVALIPSTLSYFIITTIGLYFIALPFAFILMIKLFQNEFLRKIFSFLLLYIFMIINLIAGLIMVLVLFYMVFIKKRGNIRKLDYNIDNNIIENIRNEVRNAMK
jgi:hypothetical protein